MVLSIFNYSQNTFEISSHAINLSILNKFFYVIVTHNKDTVGYYYYFVHIQKTSGVSHADHSVLFENFISPIFINKYNFSMVSIFINYPTDHCQLLLFCTDPSHLFYC